MTDRYFQAFVFIGMPWCSKAGALDSTTEIFLFEQPDMPAYDQIIKTVKKACPLSIGITLQNMHEISETDFRSFIGNSKEWEASDK